jgi:IS30 family transposase
MSAEARETVSLGLARGHSWRAMATVLRAPSTVSREHTRNAMQGLYRACMAHTLVIGSGPSATAAAHTSGSLAVAVGADASG